MEDLKLYSIMPLLPEHADEICDDIERQYRDGVAGEALFCMTLTPEGNPVIDKAAVLCEKYRVISKKLRARGLNCGALVQASIGHGYKLTTPIPFQAYTGLTDGEEKYVACPYDPAFHDYMRRAMHTIAAEKPSSIMLDDDFRLFYRPQKGCACPLHMAEVSRRLGRKITREELLATVEQDTDEARRLLKIFYDTQVDSLIGAAKAMRAGIDEVDPTLQGTFCACGDSCEGAAEIAKIMAGKGNPVIVRLNNGRYCSSGPRGLVGSVGRAAVQVIAMGKDVDLFLAETDTCPQNRYSTSAASLHSHFTATILEGARGCKHWITRLAAYEPRSGEAYRRKMSKYAGFYRSLADLTEGTKWQGCCIPLADHAIEPIAPLSAFQKPFESAWARCVLEVIGIPYFYGVPERNPSCPVMLDGRRDCYFTDGEILNMLRGTVFIGSDTACRLIERGFGEYLGVDIVEFAEGEPLPAKEELPLTATQCNAQMHPKRLIPHDGTEVHSTFYYLPDGKTKTYVSPAVTSFRNRLGGNVIVFAGTPQAQYNYREAFSFLNESRKTQLIHLLETFAPRTPYFPGDEEVYVKTGTRGDQTVCALFNLGTDAIDDISLYVPHAVKSVKSLEPDGTWSDIAFTQNPDGICLINRPAHTLTPAVLVLERK